MAAVPTRRFALTAAMLVLALVMTGCGTGGGTGGGADADPTVSTSTEDATTLFPDIVEVVLTPDDDGTFTAAVTVSSPYDSAEQYADGWRVLGVDGDVLGEHTLGHDHATEQPFTRTQTGLSIPPGTTTVTVEGRDTQNGYGGGTRDVEVP